MHIKSEMLMSVCVSFVTTPKGPDSDKMSDVARRAELTSRGARFLYVLRFQNTNVALVTLETVTDRVATQGT